MGLKRSAGKRVTYANVTSTIALVIAVGGGSAFAASRLITGHQIAKGTITAANIKSHSLLASNFKRGQLPAGPVGATGATGATGVTGATGATGAAGSAIAYGTMVINGAGNPTFGAATVGFSTVTEPQANVFCVGIPPGAGSIQPVISDAGGNNNAVFSLASPQQCSGEYEVVQESGVQISSGEGFVIMIP